MKQIKTSDGATAGSSSTSSAPASGNVAGGGGGVAVGSVAGSATGGAGIGVAGGGLGGGSALPADLEVLCRLEASTSKTGMHLFLRLFYFTHSCSLVFLSLSF